MRFVFGLVLALTLSAQSGSPTLETAYALDQHVKGRAQPGSGPVTVYDTSYPARAKLGQAVVDAEGNFAVSVKPPLKLGNKIIVEDRLNRSSPAMTVGVSRPSPAPLPAPK